MHEYKVNAVVNNILRKKVNISIIKIKIIDNTSYT